MNSSPETLRYTKFDFYISPGEKQSYKVLEGLQVLTTEQNGENDPIIKMDEKVDLVNNYQEYDTSTSKFKAYGLKGSIIKYGGKKYFLRVENGNHEDLSINHPYLITPSQLNHSIQLKKKSQKLVDKLANTKSINKDKLCQELHLATKYAYHWERRPSLFKTELKGEVTYYYDYIEKLKKNSSRIINNLVKNYGVNRQSLDNAMAGKYRIGVDSCIVYTIYGRPKDVNTTVGYGLTRKQLVYMSNGKQIYFYLENDTLKSWQN